MIKALRRRHLQIWTVLGPVLGLAITAGVLARKPAPTISTESPYMAKSFPVLFAEQKLETATVQLRGEGVAVTQLIWINEKPLQTASAAIYETDSAHGGVDNGTYLGAVNGAGWYGFQLKKQNAAVHRYFIVYDFIHRKIVGHIRF